jgi:hypothetical protein
LDRQPAQRAAESAPQPAKDIGPDTRQLADPVLNTARQPTDDVQKQLNEAAQPVLKTAEHTANDAQKQLSEATQPVLKAAQDQLNQATQPILDTAGQTLGPEKQPAEQTLDSAEQAQQTTRQPSEPLATPVQQPSAPPVPHEDTSPQVASALEGSVVRSDGRSLLPQTTALQSATSSSALEASKSASFDLSGFTSTTLESLESSSVRPLAERKQAAPASMSEHYSVVFDPAGAQSISVRVPQPSPAGATPGSLSAGSSPIFGGSGFGLGILAFLALLLLGGGPLWSGRHSLAPDSALHPILERPG